jgi:hypothetical protein
MFGDGLLVQRVSEVCEMRHVGGGRVPCIFLFYAVVVHGSEIKVNLAAKETSRCH